MISAILSFLGIGLTAISKELTQARHDKLNAKTEQERIAADERISTLESKRDIILKAQSDKYERWVRIGFSIPFVLYIWKLVLWDKVVMSSWSTGVTDDLTYNQWTVFLIVLGGYFIHSIVNRVIK